MRRSIPTPLVILAIALLAGCEAREMFLGVAEPDVHGTASPAFAPEDLTKLAVLVLPVTRQTEVRDTSVERAIADDVEAVLLAKGYTLAARADLGSVMSELALQNHPVGEADIARLGQRLGVPAVLVVAITDDQLVEQSSDRGDRHWSYRLGMSAKLVGTKRGDVWWVAKTDGTHFVEGPRQRQDAIGPVTRGLAKAFPAHQAAIGGP